MSVRETIVGQVAELFGKMRPAAGLSPEERESLAAERKGFAEDLVALLKKLPHGARKIEQTARDVFHEIKNQPYTLKVPQPYEVYRRIDSRLTVGTVKPWCPVCERWGRKLMWADGQDHPEGKARGQIEMKDGSWWCNQHVAMVAFYAHRQTAFVQGKDFPYAPPSNLIPQSCFKRGLQGVGYLEWTDGAFMTSEVEWLRADFEKKIGEQVLIAPAEVTS